MTDKQKSEVRATAAALETLDMGGVADLVRRQYAELETLRAKLKTYEDLGGAGSDVQLLRMGYAAARLEIESLKAQSAAQQPDIENLRKALQFYADSEHFIKSDGDAWDTVSGEPQNYWCDEAGTATVEDGSIARLALSGQPVQFEDDTPQSEQPGAAYAAQDSEHQLAIMGGERNASLDAYSRVVSITSAESRLYERAFTSGWDRRDRLASYGQAPAQAAPAAVAGSSDLRTRCEEILAWRKTGVLPGEALRTLAREKYGDEYDAIQRAERDTETEAMNFVTVAPTTQPAPAAQGDALDAARWHWLAEYLVGPRTDLDDEIVASETVNDLRKLVDDARAAQEGKSHDN